MIDRGLLATVLVMVAIVAALDRWLRRRVSPAEPILALASAPMLVGLAVGRLAAVVQDDPATLRRPFDLLLIRGGVEFWPGVAAAAAVVWVAARREKLSALGLLAELAPFALWAYAAYEASCLLREGCFGPSSPIGLQPGGQGDAEIPVGLLVGVCAGVLGRAYGAAVAGCPAQAP